MLLRFWAYQETLRQLIYVASQIEVWETVTSSSLFSEVVEFSHTYLLIAKSGSYAHQTLYYVAKNVKTPDTLVQFHPLYPCPVNVQFASCN